MSVKRRPGESIESLIRRFRRETKNIVIETKARQHYTKKSEQKKRRKERAKSRSKK